MGAPRIPDWKERLKACFQWRHRAMHVFGAPSAVGAIVAVVTAASLNPDVGLGLGALTATMGALLAGYYITAGFDHKLVKRLQDEEVEQGRATEEGDVNSALAEAEPELQPTLHRIVGYYANIEGAFADGIDDNVESILQTSRGALRELRDRAIALSKLHLRLRNIIVQSDGQRLYQDLQRMTYELQRAPDGPVRDAMEAAKESTERTFKQWQAAVDKQAQIRSVLTVIESNLQEFKLAMELRKADVALGEQASSPDVSDLQARLVAAGDACDEIVGRARRRRRTTA